LKNKKRWHSKVRTANDVSEQLAVFHIDADGDIDSSERLAFHVEERLGLDDGLLFRERVISMQLQLIPSGFIIDVAKRYEAVFCPLREWDVDAAFFGHLDKVGVRLAIQVCTHGFDLEIHHVSAAAGPVALVFFFATKG